MSKFQVKILEVHSVIVDVEADNECDARSKASDLLAAGCYPNGKEIPDSTYDHTLESDTWQVWEE